MNVMYKISYGLYVLTARGEYEGKAIDNGCMINTLVQLTSTPQQVALTVNKANLTHNLIKQSGVGAVSVLAQDAPFELIKRFGFSSGKAGDKIAGLACLRTKGGITVPEEHVLGYIEFRVVNTIDVGTHTTFIAECTECIGIKDAEPLTYAYYQAVTKPRPAPVSGESWVCRICGHVVNGEPAADYICPICKHGKEDFIKQTQATATENAEENKNNIQGELKMKKYVCSVCGYVYEGEEAPAQCPVCKVPREKFKEMSADLSWAAEHVVGVAQGVREDIIKDLRANFEGECSEVGMYLAMSRVAIREGYPEIGAFYHQAALEEAEHAAKFAELLGEVVTDSTKKNLELRVAAENGATAGKVDLAKRAKELNLDAIHDTVHEMARDEARHGKGFEGLLKRYFK